MVKLRHKGLLVLGMNRTEIERLQHGFPLPIKLDDLHASLKGQMVLVIPGKDDATLHRVMQDVAQKYENGATSIIEIAKSIPKTGLQ